MQNSNLKDLITSLMQGDKRALARCITIVENELDGHMSILKEIKSKNIPLIGITGPPGAGKSTLINALLTHLSSQNKKVGVIAIDPTSPFNYGSILGDRVRMSEHFNNENIFIRSLATRGSLGGLSAKTIEIADLMRASGFDMVIIETVGVGQTELEIAGLADTTILVLVPEAGDEVQNLKSGIMEIADIFVLNKADRPGADSFIKNMKQLLHTKPNKDWNPPILKAIATKHEGIDEIIDNINKHHHQGVNIKRPFLFTEKAFKLIQSHRMKNVDRKELHNEIEKEFNSTNFNLYNFIEKYF